MSLCNILTLCIIQMYFIDVADSDMNLKNIFIYKVKLFFYYCIILLRF